MSLRHLNDNIISDFQYDENARQLEELSKAHPEESKRSRYYEYFHDFFDSDEHATSGFDLLKRVEMNDLDLYSRIMGDAMLALKLSRKG